jgi:fumarate reductase subunit D
MHQHNDPGNPPDQSLIISFLTLRKAVGILGIFLPVGLVAGVPLLSECRIIQDSISDYYYTRMSSFMTGTLCAVGLFLFCYKGYEKRDTVASQLACLFALGIAFFPTAGPDKETVCNSLHRNSAPWVSAIHDISAALFFLTLAYFSLMLFTKSSGRPTPQKLQRNRVYRICGYTILACIILLVVYAKVHFIHLALKDFKPVLILEIIAIWAFGFSWLTKGEFILKDK